MSEKCSGYACQSPGDVCKPWQFDLHPMGPDDVEIEVTYCGLDGTDVQAAQGDFGPIISFPLVPGHETIGYVTKVGPNVKKFKVGDRAGVGPKCLSCLSCPECTAHREPYCKESKWTYGAKLSDGFITKGGFAQFQRCHQNFVFHIPDGLSSAEAAPLLSAGVTCYSPFRYAGVGKGMKVGVCGIGGLGHIGLRIANALGAEVYALSTSPSKKEEALRLGAQHFINIKNETDLKAHAMELDMILNTSPAMTDMTPLLGLLKCHGKLALVGAPAGMIQAAPMDLLRHISISGTMAGSPEETEEMLFLCAKHHIGGQIEIMPLDKINEGMKRVADNKARYRVVLAVNPELDQQRGRRS